MGFHRPTTCKLSCAFVSPSATDGSAAGADSFDLAAVGRQREHGVGEVAMTADLGALEQGRKLVSN